MKLTVFLECPRLFAGAMTVLMLTAPVARAAETSVTAAAPDAARSVEVIVAETLEKNPELKFYEAEIAAAQAGRKSAGVLGNPALNFGVGQKTVRGGGLSEEGVAWSVSLMQPFEWPGRLGLRKAIANRDLELARLGHERFKAALAGRVRTLAYGLFATQEKSVAAAEVAERFKALREVLVQRDPAGLTPLLETRVIEATELNAQRESAEARLSVQAALLELNQLRGVAPETLLTVRPVQLAFRPAESRSELIALAQTNNFELRLRAVELAQQGFRVELAKNQRYPAISVGPTISEERAGDRERVIGVGISLPLPLWTRNKSGVEAASARELQAEVSMQVAAREVTRKVLEAAQRYETNVGEMARWRPDAVQHFKEAAELADRHYRLGAVPISTYVELQKQYLEAVEGLLDTKREALEASVELELLTGLTMPLVTAAAKEEKP